MTDSSAPTSLSATFSPPTPGSTVGIALRTKGLQPLNALRHPPEGHTSGWYIWWGEPLSEDEDFLDSLCVEHLGEAAPELLPYLGLPPGWRVLLAPGYEDVWEDPSLLKI